ncbi:OadG family transporter subunit [uncultured Rikenella sp.]|uniref:OadG family transporter subunit n=1 Tax=uncultured Rikenella sp. TaxID=368003 RepID=UPI002631F5EA|nr:OadG family transporter subunit [uncultured Rikenella sp.]
MMKRLLLMLVLAALCAGGYAQGLKDIRINEVLVDNRSSYVDDHGNHEGWIELHNTGYSNVNIGGAYLTVRRGDLTRTYRIPKNDSRTLIPPQGYVIFFADSSSNRGTFHTNFVLDETGYLAFMDQGRNVVDSVVYDVTAQLPDVSIGWAEDTGTGAEAFGPLAGITPMQANETEEKMPAAEKFRLRDPSGVVMAITAMSVVFSALILLFFFFKNIGRLMIRATTKKEETAAATVPNAAKSAVKPERELVGEEIAAIAIALRRYEEDMHDIESHILTINRVARAYSPWSSKIYGLNNQPIRK